MHSIFLGGMSQFYYDETDQRIKEDDQVPFVDDVTMMMRDSGGTTTEMVLPITLPGLLGTNATLFLEPSLPQYENGVIKLRELGGRTLLGRVLGGIESDAPNAGWLGGNTSASDRMFEVYVTAYPVPIEDETPTTFAVLPATPNPFRDETHLNLRLDETQQISVEVFDLLGRRVSTLHDGLISAGSHSFIFRPHGLAGGVYIVRVVGKNGTSTHRIAYVR